MMDNGRLDNKTMSGLDSCGVPGITTAPASAIWPQVILYPFLLAICTVGNTIVMVVLKKEFKSSANSTHIYLFTIAICDLLMM